MARSIALKLQPQSALAVIVRTSGRAIVVEAHVPIPLAEGESAEVIGQKIATAMARFSPGRAEIVVAVPRADLHWANYDLPPAPADELPDMVQLQAARDVVLADDGLGFDYISLGGDAEHPHRVLGVGLAPLSLNAFATCARRRTSSCSGLCRSRSAGSSSAGGLRPTRARARRR